MTCALSAMHSSQMKTHCESAGLRQPPSMRVRTSCFDLPQNEQNICSCATVRDIWQLQYSAAYNMNARTICVKTLNGTRRPDVAAGDTLRGNGVTRR
jgi:hypothetical protein